MSCWESNSSVLIEEERGQEFQSVCHKIGDNSNSNKQRMKEILVL